MILFKNDWKKYPRAIPNYETKNKSFVETASVLKQMGLENHTFLLALHNPDIKDLDPFDNALPLRDKLKIALEIKENPWYYFREIAKAPAVAGTNPRPFTANRANISLYWLFFNHITTYLIQPRQTGKTFSVTHLLGGLSNFWMANSKMSMLGKDTAHRVDLIEKTKANIDEYPDYLKLRGKKDTNNTENITVKALKNILNGYVAQGDEKGALKIGRGLTAPVDYIDEFAYIDNNHITIPAMLASLSAAMDAAKANNSPYGIIFSTTAGHIKSRPGKYAYRIYKASTRWDEKFMDAENIDELKKLIKSNKPVASDKLLSATEIVLLEYNHNQLGFSDLWLAEKIAKALSEGDDAKADFLNIWSLGTIQSPFSKELLEELENSATSDAEIEITDYNLVVRWYKDKKVYQNGRACVLGLDTSEAVGKDGIAFYIMDYYTGETVVTGNFNDININKFLKWLVKWFIEYPNLTAIIERKNTGVGILDGLLDILPELGINPFKRIFNWTVHELEKLKLEDKSAILNDKVGDRLLLKYKKHFGYGTSGAGKASRDNLYGKTLMESVRYLTTIIKDPELITQIGGLVIKNNRIDHVEGGHDDMVVAFLLAYWFIKFSGNKEVYGLSPLDGLRNLYEATSTGNKRSEEDKYIGQQKEIYRMIELLIEKLNEMDDRMISMKIIAKIKQLYDILDTSVIDPINVHSIVEQIMIEKKIN